MMRRGIMVVLVSSLLLISSSVHAEKQEWYDSSFNFTTIHKIAVLFDPNAKANNIQYSEMHDIFMEMMVEDLISELPSGQYIFDSGVKIAQKIFREQGVDIAAISQTDRQKADMIAYDYICKNYDLLIIWNPIVYGTGSEYCEGYVYTMPSTNTSTVWFPNGQTATITSNGQTIHNVPGGNFPTVYVAVQVDAVDTRTGNPVWKRIDDRAKINRTAFDNTEPKDIYRRIVGKFIQDFKDSLQNRRGGKRKVSF